MTLLQTALPWPHTVMGSLPHKLDGLLKRAPGF